MERSIEDFRGADSTHDLQDWRWLWRENRALPLESHRPGLIGRLVVAVKKLLRPAVTAPQSDLWDRQRIFNLVLISHLSNLHKQFDQLGQDLQRVQKEIVGDLRAVQKDYIRDVGELTARVEFLEEFMREGLQELTRHNDALFSRVDQKIDRFRRETRVARRGDPEDPRAG